MGPVRIELTACRLRGSPLILMSFEPELGAAGENRTRLSGRRKTISLVSGKVLCEVPQVLSAVVDGGFLSRERFEMQNDQNGHGERIGTPTNNGGCILAGLCSQS